MYYTDKKNVGVIRLRINQHRGFTLVEMVAVIMILGILAFTAVPRFMDRGSVDARGFFDQAQSVIRYAQKSAVARRSVIFVQIAADTIRVCFDAACTNPIPDPANAGGSLIVNVPNGVMVNPPASSTFGFDALGRPVDAALAAMVASLTVGIASRNITIEPETGYVHS